MSEPNAELNKALQELKAKFPTADIVVGVTTQETGVHVAYISKTLGAINWMLDVIRESLLKGALTPKEKST